MDKKFDLEHQYQEYLKRVQLKESEMHEAQKRETRLAFMGACGQLLMLFRNDIPALPEPEAVEVIQDMMNQVGNFFFRESCGMIDKTQN